MPTEINERVRVYQQLLLTRFFVSFRAFLSYKSHRGSHERYANT